MVAKDYARLRIAAIHGETSEILPAYSDLNDDKLLYELLLSYYRIGNLRNQVNHAGVDDPMISDDELAPRKDNRLLLDDALSRFISLYSRACSLTKKQSEPVIISSAHLKAYVRRHELKPLEEANDFTVSNSYSCTFNGKELQINLNMFKTEEDYDA